jgi:hypothetical protein
LGLDCSFYPFDETKLRFFTAAPKNPFSTNGAGFRAGLSFDTHWERVSAQSLYAYETPESSAAPFGVHRAGLSLKAELGAGFTLDALYTYNPDAPTGIDGLSASAGADYSFFNGTVYLTAEYLFSGSASGTAFDAAKNPLGFTAAHNVYALARFAFTDFTRASAACLFGIPELGISESGTAAPPSITPIITLEHDLFQGCTLTISAQTPIRAPLLINLTLRAVF